MNADYARTVQLLLAVAPAIFSSPAFAMKGGTAINLFVQDMPRLSVDIDVVFVPHESPRDEALLAIGNELTAAQVEVNFVFRGTVLPPELKALTPAAQQLFAANIEVPVLATPELYAGKLVAALDRQHPRDLFDVQLMLAGSGWSEPLLDCFVVYLAAHNRPTHEVLFPREKALDAVFENEFVGMTSAPVSVGQLLATRQRMMRELPRVLHPRHRQFLLSIVRAEPQWDLLPYAHIAQLPALQWKLQNLKKLKRNVDKFEQQRNELAARLERAR
jgi:hypothetical protein